MSTSIRTRLAKDRKRFPRGKRWLVVNDLGKQRQRRCIACKKGAWLADHPRLGDECPSCGAALGPAIDVRRQSTSRGFASEKEAKVERDRLTEASRRGQHVMAAAASVPLRQFVEADWIPDLRLRLKDTTIDSYTRTMERDVLPTLGALPLRDVTAGRIANLLADLLDGNRKAVTVRYVGVVLGSVLTLAVRRKHLARSPLADVTLPSGVQTERPALKFWTPDQVRTFLESLDPTHLLTPLYATAAATGLRRGELCGLRWSDLADDCAVLTVTRNRVLAGGRVVETTPKSKASRRPVSIGAGTASQLRAHRTAQRLRVGALPEYAFTDLGGAPVHPDSVSSTFNRAVTRSGLPRLTLHGLRHSHVVALIAEGFSPKLIQVRLGHSSIVVTFDIYGHLLPGADEDAAAATDFASATPRGLRVVSGE
ncbi:MAG TPA: tyrosine-type recombinase/integrase [Acidimicrobiia bacterium]|nr:tyrosine-type recombinase/integrase [Acidimicrobiia bacterium]